MGRLTRVGSVAVLCLAVISFGVASFLPIYTDELTWKMIQARMHLDDFQNITTLPTCGTLAVAIPALLLPFRFLDSILYEGLADPIVLRASGVLVGLFGLGIVWLVLLRTQRGAISGWICAVLVLSFATIGIMPFLLVMSRPEQILAIVIAVLAVPLIFDLPPSKHTLSADVVRGLGLFVLCGFVIAEHPRGLFVLPLMLLFLFRYITRWSVAWTVAGCISIIGLAALRNWAARSVCSDPALQTIMLLDNITTAAAKGQLPAYLVSLLSSLVRKPTYTLYIAQFQFHDRFTSDMIPPAASPLAVVAHAMAAGAFLALLVAGACAFLLGAYRALRLRKPDVPVLALAALWAFWAASAVARVTKNDYEAGVMMPVMVIATLGSIWLVRDQISAWIGRDRWRWLSGGAFLGLIGLSLLNQAALLWTYVPWVRGAWTDPGYAAGQKWSVVPFGYDRLQPQILAAGALCGIHSQDRPRHLVVDELTYYAFRSSFQPLVASYIDERNWGRGIRDYYQFLKGMGSEGMVVGCQWIPTELLGDARQSGGFCCLPSFGG